MELIISVALLTAVIMIADVTLAIQGNFPKIVRITIAAATYVAVLGSILKVLGRFPAPPPRLPLWPFLAAGLAGGLVSGLVRSDVDLSVPMASSVLTPPLLGTVHWVALQRWGWLRQRIAGRSSSGGQRS
jgi:hypothetical protein